MKSTNEIIREIDEKRQSLGLTQKEAAQRAEMAPAAWSNINAKGTAGISTIRRMATAVGLTFQTELIPNDDPATN